MLYSKVAVFHHHETSNNKFSMELTDNNKISPALLLIVDLHASPPHWCSPIPTDALLINETIITSLAVLQPPHSPPPPALLILHTYHVIADGMHVSRENWSDWGGCRNLYAAM